MHYYHFNQCPSIIHFHLSKSLFLLCLIFVSTYSIFPFHLHTVLLKLGLLCCALDAYAKPVSPSPPSSPAAITMTSSLSSSANGTRAHGALPSQTRYVHKRQAASHIGMFGQKKDGKYKIELERGRYGKALSYNLII